MNEDSETNTDTYVQGVFFLHSFVFNLNWKLLPVHYMSISKTWPIHCQKVDRNAMLSVSCNHQFYLGTNHLISMEYLGIQLV